jgi:hypothetical protein
MTTRNSASAASLLFGFGALAAGVTHADEDSFLRPDTLVVSSSRYVKAGAVTTLNPTGTAAQLPGPSVPVSDDN